MKHGDRVKKNYIIVGLIVFFFWLMWIGTFLFIDLKLNGKEVIYLNETDTYEEEGATAYFFKKRLSIHTTHVNIADGNQVIYYTARNPFGVVRKKSRKIVIRDNEKPTIELKGSKMIVLKQGMSYKEPGFHAYDKRDGSLTKKVTVKKNIDTSKLGTYKIVYQVQDKSGNKVTTTRSVKVIPNEIEYKEEYNKIDNQVRGWGHGNKKNHIRSVADVSQEELKKYDAFYMGEDKPTIYLTFDEGANDTYLKEIVDVLKEKNVKATFFLCRHYMLSNQDLIKQMVEDGHLVGNHTWHHKSMPSLANASMFQDYVLELTKTAEAFKEITKKEMPLIYREPAGSWSYRSLKIVQDMGYRTYFWSAAYMDFGENVSKAEALRQMMSMHHNGVIYLLHPKNKGNYLALSDFIDEMRKLGYTFATVDEIG